MGTFRDHVSMAGAAHPSHRPALPRGFCQGRNPISSGDRARWVEHQSPDYQPLRRLVGGELVAHLARDRRGHLFSGRICAWPWVSGERDQSRDGVNLDGSASAAVCLASLFASALGSDGVGSCSIMSELFMDQFGSVRRKNRRVGLILALLTVLYIGAVIAFIIMY